MLGDINKSLKPYHPNVYLAKPDKTIISKLHEAYDINITYNLNGINTISFKVPYQINKQQISEDNKHIEHIRGHYLLKVDNEWFVIIKTPSNSTNDTMFVEAKSLPYQLRRRRVDRYQGNNNATEILEICLEKTGWSVGYVDGDFDLSYRDFDIEEKTKLQVLYEIAETYDGVLQFDTVDMLVSLKKLENIGSNKGLSIKYGKYLKDVEKKVNFDYVCTRLYVYGKDGLGIESINPAGTDYIEDFSYYMHPYEVDDNGNVIAHSNYMSDELCQALMAYQEFCINDSALLTHHQTLATYRTELGTLVGELESLINTYEAHLDLLDNHNATNSGVYNSKLVGNVTNAYDDIEAKKIEIDNKNSEISTEISSINDILALDKHFTAELIAERDNFLFEKKWSDHYYSEVSDLYDRGLRELSKVTQPQVAYSINVVDFLKVVECQRDWDKLVLGDIISIEYDQFNVNIEAKIIKISHNIDDNFLFIEIANSKDIKDGFYEWANIIKKSVATSSVLASNKYKWDKGMAAKSKIEEYISNAIDANKQAIVAGNNNNVVIDRRGVKIADSSDQDNYLRILHNVLAFTNDGGNTFKHAITPTGIVGEHVYGKLIAGVNLEIASSDGQSFKVNENGVTIEGSALTITNGLPTSELADGVLIEGNVYNGVKIDTDNGLVIERSDKKVRTTLNATEGFKIQSSSDGINWSNQLYADVNGNLVLAGDIHMTGGSINWSNINSPYYSDIHGGPPSNADNTRAYVVSKGMEVIDNKLYISADNIKSHAITADKLDVTNLTVSKIQHKTKPHFTLEFSEGPFDFPRLEIDDGNGKSVDFSIIGDTFDLEFDSRLFLRAGYTSAEDSVNGLPVQTLYLSALTETYIDSSKITLYAHTIDFNNANLVNFNGNVTAKFG